MLWPLSVVLVANTNGRLAIPALAGLLVLLFSEYQCFTCFTMASHFCINRPYTASLLSTTDLTIDLSAGETLVRIVAGTHPWLVCIMGAIV